MNEPEFNPEIFRVINELEKALDRPGLAARLELMDAQKQYKDIESDAEAAEEE